MTIISDVINRDSDSRNLCSERHIVREIMSYTPTIYVVPKLNETVSYSPDRRTNPNPALSSVWGPNDAIWRDHQGSIQHRQLRPEIMKSLQRSLVENADVWAELSRR
jgi:hypothetical protein